MVSQVQYTCDVCGAVKKDDFWWTAQVVTEDGIKTLVIAPWDRELYGEHYCQHLCGPDCLHRKVDEFMGAKNHKPLASSAATERDAEGERRMCRMGDHHFDGVPVNTSSKCLICKFTVAEIADQLFSPKTPLTSSVAIKRDAVGESWNESQWRYFDRHIQELNRQVLSEGAISIGPEQAILEPSSAAASQTKKTPLATETDAAGERRMCPMGAHHFDEVPIINTSICLNCKFTVAEIADQQFFTPDRRPDEPGYWPPQGTQPVEPSSAAVSQTKKEEHS